MRSMTGFGSGTYSDEKISITVEIKAVIFVFPERMRLLKNECDDN